MTLLLGSEAVDVLRRKHWRAGRRTFLLESADTNHCPRSEDLSFWTKGTGTGARTGSQTDPKGGTTANLLDDQDNVNGVLWQSPTFAFTGAVTQRGLSFFYKANTAAASEVGLRDETAGVIRGRVTITPTAGVVTAASVAFNTGSGAVVAVLPVTDQPGWYRILLDITGIAVPTNLHAVYAWPAGTSGPAMGSAYFWGFHAHSQCTPARQYWGPTAAGSVNSGSDQLQIPWLTPPGAITLYARYYEVGMQKKSVVEANSQRIIELSGSSIADPRIILYHQQPNAELRMAHNPLVGGQSTSQTVGLPTLVYGDKVEAMGLVYPDGGVQVFVSVNGGAVIAGSRGPARTFDAAWSPDGLVSSQRIKPFSLVGGSAEVERILVTPGVHTFAEAQSLAG